MNLLWFNPYKSMLKIYYLYELINLFIKKSSIIGVNPSNIKKIFDETAVNERVQKYGPWKKNHDIDGP